MEAQLNEEKTIQKIDEINNIIWLNRGTGIMLDNPVQKVQEAYDLALKINYRYGQGRSSLSMGMGAFLLQHNYEEAFRFINEAIQIFKELDEKKWSANAMLTMAIISTSAGKPETGLYHALRGIEYYEQRTDEDEVDLVMAYYVTGTAFKDLKKFEEAEKYYRKGITFNHNNTTWSGRIYTSLSNIFNEQGKYAEALELAFKSLNILKNENNTIGVSRALTDIGGIYRNLKKYTEALDHYFEGLKIREENNLKGFALGSLIEIAGVYVESGKLEEAIPHLLRAESLALEISHQARLSIVYQKLAELYKRTGHLENSISYFEKYIRLTGELNQKERDAKISNLQNSLLQEKEQEIERLKNVELKNAYHLISEKNKEITDSIQYAHRIQKALLASDATLDNVLAEHFIFFRPKDIVSGDFYWASSVRSSELEVRGNDPELPTINSELFYLAVCDSTGHGVPGAFMSLLNVTFLNEAINVKDMRDPAEIFNYVRERLVSSISQDGGKDGMDGILICLEKKDGKTWLHYSAANNAPVLVSGGEIKSLPFDKMPVGKGEKSDPFKKHSLELSPGDALYLFTDGYADQFGGPKGKKFKHKQLLDLILKNSSTLVQEQKNRLQKNFVEWQGNLEQVDDVCIIGIRF